MRKNSGIRYREDVGFELRCTACGGFWPLTFEFWQRKSFTRCKACWASYKRVKDRERSRRPDVIAARLEYQRRYRMDAKHAKRLYQQELYWADPERFRALARQRYWAKRGVILDLKRERYQPNGPRWTPEKRAEMSRLMRERYANRTPEERAAHAAAVSKARRKAA